MLDTFTLRVAFGLVALCVLVLFYGATYRTTRAVYSGWWCASLACFIVGAVLFLFNGTAAQVVANPAGNVIGVVGAGCVVGGARSLRERGTAWWQLTLVPVAVLLASAAGTPSRDVWSGGAVYLAGMAVLIGWSSVELRRVLRGPDDVRPQIHFALASIALSSAAMGSFYLLRALVFVAFGPDHRIFSAGFGSQTTTLLTLVFLVVVTYSMSALSHEQQTSELRVRATRDDLTGLLNRAEFLRAAQREVDGLRLGGRRAVLMADLDRFKRLNDGSGHAAGDEALRAFARACEEVVGDRGLVARLGGDEFVLLTAGGSAEDIAAAIVRRYAGSATPRPTVSFGVAGVDRGDDVETALARADAALYEAKQAGRDRIVTA